MTFLNTNHQFQISEGVCGVRNGSVWGKSIGEMWMAVVRKMREECGLGKRTV
jgi:hypothetical protein